MRIRFTLEITRSRPPAPEAPSAPEVDVYPDTLVEQIGQPRYFGFTPEPQ